MDIAVLIPCYNEESAIGKVVDDFYKEYPSADIYVFDNGSTDKTYEIAEKHGAICRRVPSKGKGHVIRRMFKYVSADVYILVDGDDPYNASESRLLVKEVENGVDMAVGERQNFKNVLYEAANRFLRRYVRKLFKLEENIDVVSGYRAFNKKFVKSVTDLDSNGMDIDTEYTLRAIKDKRKIVSVPVSYKKRAGSGSKFNPIIDSLLILNCISVVFWGAERKGK